MASDGFDDPFSDPFFLDDEVIESLNAAEAKYKATVAQNPQPSQLPTATQVPNANGPESPERPPRKRLKLDPPILSRTSTIEEDIPDIIVSNTGEYTIADASTRQEQPVVTQQQNRAPIASTSYSGRNEIANHLGPSSPIVASHLQQGTGHPFSEQDALQQQIATLRQELETAERVRLVKEGEISTLRRNLEKRDNEHLKDINRLKQEKTDLERQKDRAKADLNEEMVKMRNRLAFKQSELESSKLHIASSSRPPRATQNPVIGAAGWLPRRQLTKTGATSAQRPLSPVKEGKLKLTSPTKPAPAFPNFQNAFLRTSPVRAQDPTQKLKSKMIVVPTHAPEPELPQIQDIESIDAEQLETNIPDVEMGDPRTPKAESGAAAPVALNNYKPWSQRLKGMKSSVLSYRIPDTDDRGELALQSILSWVPPELTPIDQVKIYNVSSGRLMDSLTSTLIEKPHVLLFEVMDALTSMGLILLKAKQSERVALIIELLCLLTSELGSVVDAPPEADGETHPQVPSNRLVELLKYTAQHLYDTIQESGHPDSIQESRLSFGFLTLIDYLCWLSRPSASWTQCLSELIQEPAFLLFSTDFSLPTWLMCRSFDVLSVLASHERLNPLIYESLMKDQSVSKRSFLVHLCAGLAEPIMSATKAELSKKEGILTLIMALAQNTKGTGLGEHPSILASLIILINVLTALLWDEDETVMTSEALSERTVRTLFQAVLLFHRFLCKGSSPGTTLLSGILYSLPKTRSEVWSSSLSHYYVVSIGRLSYAPVPDWLDPHCKEMIEASCDLAHDLLGLIIEGPEEDLIWSAFNEGEDQEIDPVAIDEEELEARAAGM